MVDFDRFGRVAAWLMYGLFCVLGWIGVCVHGVGVVENADLFLACLFLSAIVPVVMFPVFLLAIPFLVLGLIVWGKLELFCMPGDPGEV